MQASLVFDGEKVMIPPSMGLPSPGQMQGTEFDKLGELASRICYDSLGSGRTSALLHAHILEVINLSVYEHCTFTIRFHLAKCPFTFLSFMRAFMNRKGVWVDLATEGNNSGWVVDVTTNPRAIIEWDRHTRPINESDILTDVKMILLRYGFEVAPQIVTQHYQHSPHYAYLKESSRLLGPSDLNDDQAWVSLYLCGSRGFTHEMVRHRFAMSQRSTRYVDEDGSPYIVHPLITKFLEDDAADRQVRHDLRDQINASVMGDRVTYKRLVAALQSYLTGQGVDKQTSRKQARGASRGYLGNALSSEMIYSAPVSGWKWIMKNRLHPAADAEMRGVMVPALTALKSSRYGHYFVTFNTVPSPDGLGEILG